jgi:hypothetical protein
VTPASRNEFLLFSFGVSMKTTCRLFVCKIYRYSLVHFELPVLGRKVRLALFLDGKDLDGPNLAQETPISGIEICREKKR